MQLFDDFVRTNASHATNEESSFEFLNRASPRYWDAIRVELESWFAHYPREHAADLCNRFRSSSADQHWPAWWELYLFNLHRRMGFDVEVHPELRDSTTRPDFRCVRDGSDFYLEAAVVFSGIVDRDDRHSAREGWILDLINEAKNPNFFVGIEFDLVGLERPRKSEIVRPLESWLASLDPDEVGAALALRNEAPQLELDVRDWRIRFRAVPVSAEARGRPDHRLYGFGPTSVGAVNDAEKLRKSVQAKFWHYGRLGAPLLVGVLMMSGFADRETVEEALFGGTAVQLSRTAPDDWRLVRQRNGAWMAESGPVATLSSGVAVSATLRPWTCARDLPELWLNPWAEWPLAVDLPFTLGRASDEGVVTYAESVTTAAEILGLSPDWPGYPDFE